MHRLLKLFDFFLPVSGGQIMASKRNYQVYILYCNSSIYCIYQWCQVIKVLLVFIILLV